MPEKLQALFATEPNHEQVVQRILDAGYADPGEMTNQSRILVGGKSELGNLRNLMLTAEQMTSLSRQWLTIAPGLPIKIDFELLTQQKTTLVRLIQSRKTAGGSLNLQDAEDLEGILNLLDAVQDLFEPVTA